MVPGAGAGCGSDAKAAARAAHAGAGGVRRPWVAPALRRRILVALAVAVGAPVAAAALVAVSLWSEKVAPSDRADSSFVARIRGTVTRPVVRAVGEVLRREVRRRTGGPRFLLGLSREETIARFTDANRPPAERRTYGHRLARERSPQAVLALAEALAAAPPAERAFLAELLGSTGAPSAAPRLLQLVDDADERVAVAAIRGLSAIDGADFTAELAAVLDDAARPPAVRTAAAVGLGASGTARARDALTAAFLREPGSDAAACALAGLGSFPFAEVRATFERILASPGTPAASRAAAAEALVRSDDDAAPFLLDLARNDRDAEVRAAAAWAIGTHSADAEVGPKLADLAVNEPDAYVRRRLYESLTRQTVIPAERVLATVLAEEDVAARVAGMNAVGRAVRQHGSEEAAAAFDGAMVPELARIALAGNSLNLRMRAVFGLRRGDTAAARDALGEVARSPCPEVAAAAQRGLGPVQ